MFQIISQLEGAARRFYDAEFDLFKRITDISGIIKPYPKGDARKKACLEALSKIKITSLTYLPSNPEAVVIDIDYKSGNPMQRFFLFTHKSSWRLVFLCHSTLPYVTYNLIFSAAKAPFLARFKVCQCGVKKLEDISLTAHSGEQPPEDQLCRLSRSENPNVCWQAAIFKVNRKSY